VYFILCWGLSKFDIFGQGGASTPHISSTIVDLELPWVKVHARRRAACLPFYSKDLQMSFAEERVANEKKEKNGTRLPTSPANILMET
jgi:hypothetical protein